MRELWHSLNALLAKGESVVATAVVAKDGSAPGPTGARMFVCDNADLLGTVGGGPLEGKTITEAAAVMAHGRPSILPLDLSGELGDESDAICGGLVHVFLERLDPTPENILLFGELERELAANRTCFLVSALGGDGPGRALLAGDGTPLAGGLPEPVLGRVPGLARSLATPAVVAIAGIQYFLEPFAARDAVLICGAGHIARPTAQIAAMAGFRVIVLDDREEFADPARFPWAAEVGLLPSFDDCFAGRELSADTSVVIVSRCHKQDRKILTQALRTEAGYIGMIGSSRKVAAVLEEQVGLGVPRSRVAAVHAPIGLPIGGDTPADIAVSIVAELIRERSRRQAQALAKAS